MTTINYPTQKQIKLNRSKQSAADLEWERLYIKQFTTFNVLDQYTNPKEDNIFFKSENDEMAQELRAIRSREIRI